VVETNGATTLLNEQLTYDVFDDLIGVAVSTGSTAPAHWTVYDGKNPYIDFNSSGTLTTRYLTNPQGIDQFYGRVSSGGSVAWYFTDLDGSIRLPPNANGYTVTYSYDATGELTAATDFAGRKQRGQVSQVRFSLLLDAAFLPAWWAKGRW
jgi:hypothetical protein